MPQITRITKKTNQPQNNKSLKKEQQGGLTNKTEIAKMTKITNQKFMLGVPCKLRSELLKGEIARSRNPPHLGNKFKQPAYYQSSALVHVLINCTFSCREWRTYFKDPYNYFDWLGLILTILVIPLRYAENDFQWTVAGLGYLFNFLRLFKFSCLSRYL